MSLRSFAASAILTSGLLVTAGFVQPASAVTVGSSDSGNCYPFNCNDTGKSTGQSIDYMETYRAGAVGSLTINTISFFSYPGATPFEVLSGTYDITLGTTLSPVLSLPGSLSNVATFFNGNLDGLIGSIFSISGTPYSYNSALGNLVMEVVVTNQANVPNLGPPGNSYFLADYTGNDVSRAYSLDGSSCADTCSSSDLGALVTEFNAAATPLPSTWTMLIAGFLGLGFFAYRGSKKSAATMAAA